MNTNSYCKKLIEEFCRNKLKIATALLGIVGTATICASYCFVVLLPHEVAIQNHARELQASDPQPAGSSSAIVLTVHVLPTSDGINGVGMYATKYPRSILVKNATAFSGRIEAYGAAYHVWIAPRGWSGSAAIGADGSTDVNLYPTKGSARAGPRLHYEDSGGCAGCALGAAAPYFPSAMRRFKELFDSGPTSTLPRGVKVISASPDLVTYSFPSGQNLITRGAAYFDASEPFFEKTEFVLPRTDEKLLDFLLRTFISTQNLK
ncbi:MAG: DUF4850 domain-containing protein [Candidatus Acidiferrales bacterium]